MRPQNFLYVKKRGLKREEERRELESDGRSKGKGYQGKEGLTVNDDFTHTISS